MPNHLKMPKKSQVLALLEARLELPPHDTSTVR